VLAGATIGARLSSDCDGWAAGAVRLCSWITVTTYVLAGVAKLRIGGVAWLDGDTLRGHVAFSAARLELLGGSPSPLATRAMDLGWPLTAAAVASVAAELGAPLALLSRRWATTWIAVVWLMHAGIALTMSVVFAYPLFLVAFASFWRVEWLGSVAVRLWCAVRPGRGRDDVACSS
jgi:hypothetical protein